MTEERKITSEEYWDEFVPAAGMVLISKDQGAAKVGSLHIPRDAKDRQVTWASTGVIKKVSPMLPDENQDAILAMLYGVGDCVGFTNTVPIQAPTRPHYGFNNKDGTKDSSVLVHVSDILGVLEKEKGQVEAKLAKVVKERFDRDSNT